MRKKLAALTILLALCPLVASGGVTIKNKDHGDQPENYSCSDTEILKYSDSSSEWECAADATGSGGSAIALDLADDGSNESTDLVEIAVTGDTNSVFTEPLDNKLLIEVGNNWPTCDLANTGDSALNFFSAGTFEDARISQSSVTQHEGALSVTESQVSDLSHFSPTAGISADHGAGAITATTDLASSLCGTGEILEDQGASWACITTPSGEGGFTPDADPGVDHSNYVAGHGDGTNCSAGQYPLGVDGSGNAQSCTADDTGTDDQTASEVGITDAGAYYTGTDVEAALQEVGPTMTDARTPTTHASTHGDGGADEVTITEAQISDLSHTTQFSPNADPGVDHSSYVAGHSDGANCSAGEYPLGVDAAGAVQGCTADDTGTDTLDDLSDDDLGALQNVSETGEGPGIPLVGDGASGWAPAASAACLSDGTNCPADDDVPEAGDYTNLTAGRSLTAPSTGTLDADVELYEHTKCINVDPGHSTTDWLFFRAERALTVTGVDCLVAAATSVVLTLRECDGDGGSCGTTEAAITCGTTNTTESGGIDDAAVDAGDWMRVLRGTVSGTPGQASMCVTFTLDD